MSEEESLEELAKKKLKKDLQEDEDYVKTAEIAFRAEKLDLAKKYPKYAGRIREIQSPYELESIMEEIEAEQERTPPKRAVAGAIHEDDINPQFKPEEEKFDTPEEFLSDLTRKVHFHPDPKVRREAKKKLDTLMRSIYENPSFKKLGTDRDFPKIMKSMKMCQRCGSLVDSTMDVCPHCGSRFGTDKYYARFDKARKANWRKPEK